MAGIELYLDSSLLVKLYIREPGSEHVVRVARSEPSLSVSHLHVLELTTAFRALAGRGVITARQLALAERAFDEDRAAGRLQLLAVEWTNAFRRAETLSRAHTRYTLARSLDVLHVAVAREVRTGRFLTADARQADLAEREGLEVELIGST